MKLCCCRKSQIDAKEFRDRFFSMFGHTDNADVLFQEMVMLVPNLKKKAQLLSLCQDPWKGIASAAAESGSRTDEAPTSAVAGNTDSAATPANEGASK